MRKRTFDALDSVYNLKMIAADFPIYNLRRTCLVAKDLSQILISTESLGVTQGPTRVPCPCLTDLSYDFVYLFNTYM